MALPHPIQRPAPNPSGEKTLMTLFLLVLSLQFLTQASVNPNGSDLKVFVPALYAGYLIFVGLVIYKYREGIRILPALAMLGMFVIYPVIKTVFDVFDEFSFKRATDGFLGVMYCGIPPGGMAAALVLQKTSPAGALKKFAVIALPVAVIFYSARGFANHPAYHTFPIIESYLIPVALSVFVAATNRGKLWALACIALIGVTAASTWNRSFVLVAIYLACCVVIFTRDQGWKNRTTLLTATMAFMAVLVWAVFSLRSGNADTTTVDKFQFASLKEAFDMFRTTGDPLYLLFWEGNSRAYILQDAFYNFTISEWIWGRGAFGVYESFVSRGVIEMGAAQEIFWWGLAYFIPLVVAEFLAFFRLVKGQVFTGGPRALLMSVLLVKCLDMLILGLPTVSGYSLLFFTAISSLCIKPIMVPTAREAVPYWKR